MFYNNIFDIDFSCRLEFKVIVSIKELRITNKIKKMSGVKNYGSYDANELQKIYDLCHDKDMQKEQDEVRIHNSQRC